MQLREIEILNNVASLLLYLQDSLLVRYFFFPTLATVRWFLFGLITVITMGKVQFWILPNLENEKCGFFASFMPLYSIERHSKSRKGSKKKKVSETEPKSTESEKTIEEESDASASDRENGDFDEQETNTQSSS